MASTLDTATQARACPLCGRASDADLEQRLVTAIRRIEFLEQVYEELRTGILRGTIRVTERLLN